MDVFGRALLDYLNDEYTEDIKTFSSLGQEDVLPLPYLFRGFNEMPPLEQKALSFCKGNVLDIGAGAGSHCLYLQNREIEVTALDKSKGAIETCIRRGVEKCVHMNILDHNDATYDTLLLLMNGIGVAGTLKNLRPFLNHLKSLLSVNGQILLDSSNIIYMFEEDIDGGVWVPNTVEYYGEVSFSMSYKGEKSDAFTWLYVDFDTLKTVSNDCGFHCELVSEGEHYDYLARLKQEKD